LTLSKGNLWRFIRALVIVILFVAITWPRLAAAGYHLFEGDVTRAGGMRVTVPQHFVPIKTQGRQDNAVLYLFSATTSFSYIWNDFALISFFELPNHHAFSYDRDARLMDSTIKDADDAGFKLTATRELKIAQRQGYCLAFVSNRNPKDLLERCFIENSSVVVYFSGSLKYSTDFRSVLDQILLD
jgi:hypothetical protein